MIRNSSRAAFFHVAANTYLSRPTTDLYFVNAMGHLIRGVVSKGPIQPIGVNSFQVGDVAVLLRQDNAAAMHEILNRRWRKLVYVVDDDIEAGIQDHNLSLGYRNRLERQYQRCYRPMLRAADHIVTGSDLLAKKMARHGETHAIDPYWRNEIASVSASPGAAEKRPFRMVYLGAMSHAADLADTLPAIEHVLRQYPNVEFTCFLESPELKRMAAKHRVVIRPMRTWNHYRRWVGTERFDLALYPVAKTSFNDARSVNKLIEHAVVGAVGIYSASWAQSRQITHGVNGFLATDRDSWIAAMIGAIRNHDKLQQVFLNARNLAVRLNDVEAQRAFWTGLLPV